MSEKKVTLIRRTPSGCGHVFGPGSPPVIVPPNILQQAAKVNAMNQAILDSPELQAVNQWALDNEVLANDVFEAEANASP